MSARSKFSEALHPRAADGKFTRKGSGRSSGKGLTGNHRQLRAQPVQSVRIPAYTDNEGVRHPASTGLQVAKVRGKGVRGKVRAVALNRDASKRIRAAANAQRAASAKKRKKS